MTYKLKSYVEIAAMTDEQRAIELAPKRAETTKKRCALKKAEIDEEIAALELQIQEGATEKNIDFDELADAIDQIALLELRKQRFDEIAAQLFPAD